MLYEKGRIVAVESDALWIETIRQSVCGSCVAQKGCGQQLLAKFGAQPGYLRVLSSNGGISQYAVGDWVTVGIPKTAVVKASLLVYLVPLIAFITFAASAHVLSGNDFISIIAGISGLIFGGLLVRLYSFQQRHNTDFQPRIIESVLLRE